MRFAAAMSGSSARRGGTLAEICESKTETSGDIGRARSAVMPPASPPRHLSKTERRVSKAGAVLGEGGTGHRTRKDQMRGFGQAGEGLGPGQGIGRKSPHQ